MIRAVAFDVGEVLVNEAREYGTWADWLAVPRHTFSAVFGAVIARGLDYRETFQVFKPGFDLDEERRRRADAGKPEWFGEDDLYPDLRPVLAELHDDGFWLGVAGNQTLTAGKILRELALPVDLRHTGNAWAATSGAGLRDLMARMGHDSERAAIIYQNSRVLHQPGEKSQVARSAGYGSRRRPPVVAAS